MINLKKFETHSSYEEYINDDPILPNITLCEDGVHYNKALIVPNNEIWYKHSGETVFNPSYIHSELDWEMYFGANLVSNTYENGMGKMVFDKDVTILPLEGFRGGVNNGPRFSYIGIPDTVTYIDGEALGFNTYSKIKLPASLITINSMNFLGCENLKVVEFPEGTREVQSTIAYDCPILENIIFPESVEYIGGSIGECPMLTSITYKGTMEQWGQIILGGPLDGDGNITVVHCSDGDINIE